jgi:hypothetical protein
MVCRATDKIRTAGRGTATLGSCDLGSYDKALARATEVETVAGPRSPPSVKRRACYGRPTCLCFRASRPLSDNCPHPAGCRVASFAEAATLKRVSAIYMCVLNVTDFVTVSSLFRRG